MSIGEGRLLVGRKTTPNTGLDARDMFGSDASASELENLSCALQLFIPENQKGSIYCSKYAVDTAQLLVAFRHPEYAKGHDSRELIERAKRYAIVLDCVQSDCSDIKRLPEGPGSFPYQDAPWEFIPYDGKYALVLIYEAESQRCMPVARLSFSPWPSKGILVYQNQGIRKQAYYLNQFIYYCALFAAACDWAKRNNVPNIGIISHKSHKLEEVKESERCWRFYDGVAQRFGLEELTLDLEYMQTAKIYASATESFKFDDKLGVWMPPRTTFSES